MKYLSLFSGIGGFELGIKQAYENIRQGRESGQMGDLREHLPDLERDGQNEQYPPCIGYSEIDKYAIQIYEKHFNHTNYGDITKIKAEDLPEFDLILGGFPCQSFSIAGKRGGFADTRGTLFFDIARIIKAKQPRLLLLENVKGLLSHDKGDTFRVIISTLDELGYDLQWQVLNSKNFGVPQNRERVFIVGHLRGTSRPQVFPFGESNPKDIRKLAKEGGNHNGGELFDTDGISPTLTAGGTGGLTNNTPKIQQREHGFFKGNESDIAPSIRGSSVAHNVFVNNIRRLTPTECERLQGFPDGWTEGVSDTQRYKCLGNAVTVNVIQSIVSKLI